MKKYAHFLLGALAVVLAFGACNDDPPTLNLNPQNITFAGTVGDKHQLTISTDGEWRILHCPEWLAASTTSGSGSANIELTTTRANNDGNKRQDQLQIEATNSGGGTQKAIDVIQLSSVEEECFARPVDDRKLVMSYGVAAPVVCGSNTSYFYYTVMPDTEWDRIKSDNQAIERQATASGSQWERITYNPTGANEIVYSECQPSKKYYLVTLSFANGGSRGIACDMAFTTMPKDDQARVDIIAEGSTVTTDGDGNSGKFYKWTSKKNNFTDKYYTYVCASSQEFSTLQNRFGGYGEVDDRNGIGLAWAINKLIDSGETAQGSITDPGINASPAREKIFPIQSGDGASYFAASNNDKYIEIATWAMTDTGKSGIVSDVIYHVDNGVLREVVGGHSGNDDYSLTVSPLNITISSDGASRTVSLSGNDRWTASTNSAWLTLSAVSGTAPTTLTITAQRNGTGADREATVIVRGQNTGASYTINVSQPKATASINQNCWAKPDLLVAFADGYATSWNCSSEAQQTYATVYKASSYNSRSGDEDALADDIKDGNTASNYSNVISWRQNSSFFTGGTDYVLCTVSYDASGVRGPVQAYHFTTLSSSAPIATISSLKPTTSNGDKLWTWSCTLKNGAKSYYCDFFDDEAYESGEEGYIAWHVYYYIKSGELDETYDWTSVKLNRSTTYIAVCNYAVGSNNQLGQPDVAIYSNGSSTRAARQNTSERIKPMKTARRTRTVRPPLLKQVQ